MLYLSSEKPLISIYTPTYNRAQLLKDRAIKSVLKQTYENFELIIVSDGSTDNTTYIVKEEMKKDPRIRYFEIERKRPHHNYDSEKEWYIGGSHAANFALNQVKGEWIARIDDDDIWTEDHLEKLLRFAMEGDYEFVSSKYIYEKRGEYREFSGIYMLSPYFYPKRKGINIDSHKIGGHSTWLYHSYLKKMKYNTKAYKKKWNRVEDPDLSLRMYEKGVRMGFLEDITLYILPRPNEITIGFDAVKSKMELIK